MKFLIFRLVDAGRCDKMGFFALGGAFALLCSPPFIHFAELKHPQFSSFDLCIFVCLFGSISYPFSPRQEPTMFVYWSVFSFLSLTLYVCLFMCLISHPLRYLQACSKRLFLLLLKMWHSRKGVIHAYICKFRIMLIKSIDPSSQAEGVPTKARMI